MKTNVLSLLCILALGSLCSVHADDFLSSHENALGISLELTLTCEDPETAKQAARTGTAPAENELANLVKRATQRQWQVQAESHQATRLSTEPLSLNAIAKGTILDLTALHVQQQFSDIYAVMINIGGDINVAGDRDHRVVIPNPDRVAVNAAPLLELNLRKQTLAASGAWSLLIDISTIALGLVAMSGLSTGSDSSLHRRAALADAHRNSIIRTKDARISASRPWEPPP